MVKTANLLEAKTATQACEARTSPADLQDLLGESVAGRGVSAARGMGQRPMSTFPGSIPCAVGRACLGRTELASRGAVCLAAASGWVHVADAASRALASMPRCPSFALDKRSSAASAHVLACEVVKASDAAACPARSMSGEAGERSEPNLFIPNFGTHSEKA